MNPTSQNIVYHHGEVTRAERERLLGQRGCALWFTGLSGSGKSTIARALERRLTDQRHVVQVLDGDNVRHGLNKDLGFSDQDRTENIRRIAEVAALSVDVGLIVLTAFISPFRADRDRARAIIGPQRFLEVFVDAPLDECEKRDPKGLYKRARAGEIAEFTGISSPYEPPDAPEIVLTTGRASVDECVERTLEDLRSRDLLSPPAASGPAAADADTRTGP